MPFPAAGTKTAAKPLPKKGKSSGKRYAIAYVLREDDSNNPDTWKWEEVKSTNVASATTALLKKLNTTKTGKPVPAARKLRKTGIVVLSCYTLERGQSLFGE